MARKSKAGSPTSAEALGQSVVDSAQKIWLAGLGAFSRARTEGDGLFNTLVEQGKGMRERARDAADQALTAARSQADATFSQAQGKWDKLEQVFEERVSRSLNRLGVMTRDEMDDLNRQVQELNKSVQALMKAKSPSRAARPRATAKKKASRKARRGTATRA
jgi:poly(hydroxyalkanoate) granule-associated protein